MMKRTNNLKSLIAQRNKTIEQIAKETGLSTRTIVKIKKNRIVRTDMLERLCEYFRIDLPDLFTFTYVESETGNE